MKKTILLFFIVSFSLTSIAQQYVWTKKANVGGGGRYAAFGFSIGNKGYIGSGVDFISGNMSYTKVDFWEYDPTTDVWTQKADIPGTSLNYATGFSIGNLGYITLGWTGSGVATTSTYAYDPLTNTWTQKANYGGGGVYCAASFVIDTIAYVGMGYAPLSNQFWKYDPSSDAWTQIANIGGPLRQAGSGFSLNNLGYVFGGGEQFSLQSSELWQYDPAINTWLQKASMPDTGRNAGTAFALNGFGFVGTGGNDQTTFSDFWKYDPVTDSWEEIAGYGGGKRNTVVSFVIGNKAYAGTGSFDIYPNLDLKDDFWEFIYTDANNITGKLYYDFNNNQTHDSGEVVIQNKLISETNTGRIAFSGLNGDYNLAVLDSGNFIATTDSAGFFAPNPTVHNVYFSSINTVDSLNDFAFQASTVINDLCISKTPLGNFRAGFDGVYSINYENNGTTILSPTIIFHIDTNVVYTSSSLTPTSITSDSVVWNLPPLSPFQQASFTVTVTIDVSTPIGTIINCPTVIEPIAGDANPSCNYDFWEVTTTGSFDPNDISVSRSEITTTELPGAPYLDYVIRFQNTGNDTAFTVDILNEVPAGVNLNTFELVASSHTVAVRYIDAYNSFGFKFNNILLVDSNHNEPLSHGFVHYRIKPLTSLVAGNIIENFAAIYFDFNAPVITNTATTLIVNPTSVNEIASNNAFVISPNIIKDKIFIDTDGKSNFKITVWDTDGKKLLNITASGKRIEIPFKNYAKGIYILQLENNGEYKRAKILKD